MSFQQFKFPQVLADLGLTLSDQDQFHNVPPLTVTSDFLNRILEGMNLASAINTEKARSEFVIAPILFELRWRHEGGFGLFSGVELDGDATRGLNGICDFILTKSLNQHIVSSPIITIIAAKNDNLQTGLGQCIAAMVAAQMMNPPSSVLFGAVTIGGIWKFLKIEGSHITLDRVEYLLSDLDRIMGILDQIIRTA